MLKKGWSGTDPAAAAFVFQGMTAFRVCGLGFGFWRLRFRVLGLGVWGLGLGFWGLGFRV